MMYIYVDVFFSLSTSTELVRFRKKSYWILLKELLLKRFWFLVLVATSSMRDPSKREKILKFTVHTWSVAVNCNFFYRFIYKLNRINSKNCARRCSKALVLFGHLILFTLYFSARSAIFHRNLPIIWNWAACFIILISCLNTLLNNSTGIEQLK